MVLSEAHMDRFEHGGDIYRHAGVIDYSANLNPFGMPDGVAQTLREHIADFEAYPDPKCQELTEKLAAYLGVPAAQVLATAGASDLMARVCQVTRPMRALVTAPCYSGYEQALEQVGATIERHALREEEGFALTERVLDDVCGGVDLVFLASPNNPTGVCVDAALLEQVLDAARETGATVVLDECFIEFTEHASALPLVERYPNLVLMRAFTTTYALAGLRLGYGVCSGTELVDAMARAGQPWAVSTPAQLAGCAALDAEPEFSEKTRAYVAEQRAFLCATLESAGMKVIESAANYVLFKSEKVLYEPLLERGIMVRRCGNYQGLGPGWYRIAVRTQEENLRFAAALEEVVKI